MKEASKNDFFAYMLLQIWAVAPISSSAFCSSSLVLCSAGLGFELVTAGRFRFEKPARLCLGGLAGQTRFRFSFNSPLNAATQRPLVLWHLLCTCWWSGFLPCACSLMQAAWIRIRGSLLIPTRAAFSDRETIPRGCRRQGAEPAVLADPRAYLIRLGRAVLLKIAPLLLPSEVEIRCLPLPAAGLLIF